jgi:uncharacterized protein (DUF169 family)
MEKGGDSMATSQMAEKSQFVYDNLRLKTFPVGVKFLKEQQELPERARRPALFLKKKITICQAMTMARNYGWQMGITAEDVICVLASLAFGFTTATDARKEMAESFFESDYKSNMEKTVSEVDQMCFLDTNEYRALLISPLHKIPILPTLLCFMATPRRYRAFCRVPPSIRRRKSRVCSGERWNALNISFAL